MRTIRASMVGILATAMIAGLGGTAQAGVLLSDDFNDNSLDTSKWTALTPRGDSTVVEQNQRMEITGRAYLNTAGSFDPIAAPLTITGQWTFAAGDDFMQILTRSDGVPAGGYHETQRGLEIRLSEPNDRLYIEERGGAGLADVAVDVAIGNVFNFEIVDDGTSISIALTEVGGDATTAALSSPTSYSSGSNLVVFHNREGGRTSYLDDVSIATLDILNSGRVLASSGGQLQGAAYATTEGNLYAGATPWTLERADTLGGPRTPLASGNSAHGDQTTDLPFTTPPLDLDPGFESGGLDASSWTTIADGLGGPNNQAFVIATSGAGFAGPIGSYMLGLTNSGARDSQHELLWVRSADFELAAGDLNFNLQGGQGSGDLPTGVPGVDFTLSDPSTGSGYMGVALRNALTGEWLLTDRRSGNSNSWQVQGWTAAELAGYVGQRVTLDIIDNYHGGWGWMGVDAFTVPFVAEPGGPISLDPAAFYFLTVRGEEVFAGQVAAIPEPSTFALALIGLLGVAWLGWRRFRRS